MNVLWVSVAAAWVVWCNLVLGPLLCGTAAVEAHQNNLGYEKLKFRITSQTTGNDYSKLMDPLRDYLSSGKLSNDIPLLRAPTLAVSNSQRFVLVELTNDAEQTITLAIDVVNVYVVAYQAGSKSFFFGDAPDGSKKYLFTSTTQATLPFKGSYTDLERQAGTYRDQISLGTQELIQAVTALYYSSSTSDKEKARSLIIIIQMISEAARFQPIFSTVRQNIESGGSFKPDMCMLGLETSWGQLSTQVQQSVGGVFNRPIIIPISTGNFITFSKVSDVIGILKLMLFEQSSSFPHEHPSPLLLIRPVVAAAA